ncbi:MAG TPA: tRNA (adenosine(37)-N6)-dimethylallyltransferase MiaA [Steroidobacteraceae bacterium]|nr:tRNA (adenosine(37)-N6)-dimethylallyltransferase MiaA [Steroidobacteraceae bacterium]
MQSIRDADIAAVVLTGPTGAGKSEWALRLAEELPVEIVSVDSALVYRGMDIGTAKPDALARARTPHHLIDIRDAAEVYSAGEFVADCTRLIADIRSRGRLPLLVGGTMLYLRALVRGIAELPRGSLELRREIDARAAVEGWPSLHAELARLDPEAAARIHPNDPQRIQRALEVCLVAGLPLTALQRATRSPLEAPLPRWALAPADRSVLHERLARRLAQMMEQGFLAEVERLRSRPELTARHPALRAVGYRQLWAHLDGAYGLDEARERALAATRQLAKRQLTWLRSDPEIRWVDSSAAGAYEAWKHELRRELVGTWPRTGRSW